MTRRLTRLTLTTLLVASALDLLAIERQAYALQGGEDPALLPVLVDKRYGSKHRHQLSLNFSTAVATKFIESTGVAATYAYNFTDMLGLELMGAFNSTKESSIMSEVRTNFPNQEPPLKDLYQLVWGANLDAFFVPLYGKISFASEVDPSYDFFLVAGAGLGGLKRQLGSAGAVTYDNKVSVTFNAGLGFRFYITKLIGLRIEFRDIFYPDGDSKQSGNLTNNLLFQGGVQFALGGDS